MIQIGVMTMAKKISNKMVAVCSVAIGIVYSTGYTLTMPTAAEIVPTSTAITSSAAVQTPQSNAGQKQGASQKQQKSKYRDGTYTGQGSNRIGSVEVAVTIKSDKITNVQITDCNTHYSESYITQLPQQVLQRQNEKVDVVSGATKSTEDFRTAVRQALDQALT
jgi:uncharacterized protein with FMN-binding domain